MSESVQIITTPARLQAALKELGTNWLTADCKAFYEDLLRAQPVVQTRPHIRPCAEHVPMVASGRT